MNELATEVSRSALALMLILARVGGAVSLLPGLGESGPPPMVRAGFALGLALLLLPLLGPAMADLPGTGMAILGMTLAEALTGLWFGWLARMVALALPTAAQVIAYLLGLSSVLQPDPELGPQSTALARLAELTIPTIVLATDLYQLPLGALTGLYRLVPPGQFLPEADSAEMAVVAVVNSFGLALRLASPFVLAAIMWHVAIGLTSRLVPRLQVYFVSLPGQIIGGLVLLLVVMSAILEAWQIGIRSGFQSMPGMV